MFDSITVATIVAVLLVFVGGLFAGLRLNSWILEEYDDIQIRRRIPSKPRVAKISLFWGSVLHVLFYAAVAAISVGILSMSIQWTVHPAQFALLSLSQFSSIFLIAVVLGQPLAVKTKI